MKQLRDGPWHRGTADVEFLETFENCLRWEIFDNAQWIHRVWDQKI